jgi:carbamoyl-phosphate synthase large subunit
VPFVAKAIGVPLAKIAARVMAGEKLRELPAIDRHIAHVAVKEAVFPFSRFPGIDPVLSPEMKSTGEVMGIDRDFTTAFVKAQLGAGTVLPESGAVFVSVKDGDKAAIVAAARTLVAHGFTIVATGGTADHLARAGVPVERINKVAQGRPHIVDRIKDGGIALIFNTTEGWQSLKDSQPIRGSALAGRVPHFTTASAAVEAARAIAAAAAAAAAGTGSHHEVRPLQSYHSRSHD